MACQSLRGEHAAVLKPVRGLSAKQVHVGSNPISRSKKIQGCGVMATLWDLTPALRVQVLPALPDIGANAENTHYEGGYTASSSGASCKPVVFGLDWCDSSTSHHT